MEDETSISWSMETVLVGPQQTVATSRCASTRVLFEVQNPVTGVPFPS